MTDKTCDQRINDHLKSRLAHVGGLLELTEYWHDSPERPRLSKNAQSVAEDLGVELDEDGRRELPEVASEALWALPLGVSTSTVFKVELSTGGPADWLEVEADPIGEDYGVRYDVTRITYHFADWFDHAEQVLTDRDFETAERFARQVVAELAE